MPDEAFRDEYQDYLLRTGQEVMTEPYLENFRRLNIDEANETLPDDMQIPYEDPTGYVEYWGALVPMPAEWTPEELGYDEDGYHLEDEEPDQTFLPDE